MYKEILYISTEPEAMKEKNIDVEKSRYNILNHVLKMGDYLEMFKWSALGVKFQSSCVITMKLYKCMCLL